MRPATQPLTHSTSRQNRNSIRLHLLGAVSMTACPTPTWTEPVLLGGAYVAADTLKHGERVYVQNCRACHGDNGDGKGPSSYGMSPKPRDLTSGIYHFAAVPNGYDLPRDAEMMQVLENGIHGTPMFAWDLPFTDKTAVLQYIKTLAPVWSDPTSQMAPHLEIGPDPFVSDVKAGIELGETVYHGKAGCWGCHPAYVTEDQVFAHLLSYDQAPLSLRPHLNRSLPLRPLPPDFNWDGVKISSTPLGVYRTIARGLRGTPMPAFESTLSEEEMWAVSHYVNSIVDKDDS